MEFPKFEIALCDYRMIVIGSIVYCKESRSSGIVGLGIVPLGEYSILAVSEIVDENTFLVKVSGLANNYKEWIPIGNFQEFTPKSIIDFYRETKRQELIKAHKKWNEGSVVDWIEEHTKFSVISKVRLEALEDFYEKIIGGRLG
jgi:hypothetical protein